jgi:hypothetical protein
LEAAEDGLDALATEHTGIDRELELWSELHPNLTADGFLEAG